MRDGGQLEGCPNTDAKQKDVRSACAECYPPVKASCEVLTVDGLHILAVIVGASEDRPHFSGPAYVRRGSENIAVSKEAFDELVHMCNSQAGAILRLKGEVVSVIALQHNLGEAKIVVDQGARQSAECRVVDCDAHTVLLFILADGRTISEPLEHVQVGYDVEKGRARLVVRGY